MGWGGTAVILNADRVGAQLKTIAPKLTDYRAVAADGVHTRTPHILWDTIWAPEQLLGVRMTVSAHIPALMSGEPYDNISSSGVCRMQHFFVASPRNKTPHSEHAVPPPLTLHDF